MEMRTNRNRDRPALPVSAVVTGAVASLASVAALALLARAEGKGPLQPINATSHWLHGDKAAQYDELDATHTLIGFVTHYASAVFWALPFEFWRAKRYAPATGTLLRGAGMTAAVAAGTDYSITPKRFTPGWELVLSRRSMVVTYAALALGLLCGTKLAQAIKGTWR